MKFRKKYRDQSKKNRIINKKNCSRLIGPVIFFLIIYFFIDLNKIKTIMERLKWPYFFLSLSVVPFFILIRSIRWKIILYRLNIHYTLWEYFKINFAESVAVMVVAAIGTFVKVLYLRRDGHGLLKPCLSIITDKYYDYLLPLLFGLTSIFLVLQDLTPSKSLIAIFLIILISFYPSRRLILIFSTRFIPKRIKKIFYEKGWNINDHLMQIYSSLDLINYTLSVCGLIIYFFSIYLLSEGIGLDLNFAQIVLIMTIASLSRIIPISFLGIGTRDIGLIAVFQLFNRTPEEAILLSITLLLYRLTNVLIGSIFWFMNPPPLSLNSGS